MASPDDLIPCPGGCGAKVHRNAVTCPHCGYSADLGRLEELLSSLSTVSSILTGFALAALVQLASEESKAKNEATLQWTTGLWILASLLLLGVMVCSELLRRREAGGGRMRPQPDEDDRLWRRTEWLLGCFALALSGAAAGVVVLGFHFSIVHGFVGCLAVGAVFFLLWRIT
jgi:hypothetical protein